MADELPQKPTKKRGKKAQAKESAQVSQAVGDQHDPSKDFALQAGFNLANLAVTKQESSGKEKGFHKLPYTTQYVALSTLFKSLLTLIILK